MVNIINVSPLKNGRCHCECISSSRWLILTFDAKCTGCRVESRFPWSSRFTPAVCSPRQPSCWPVSRDGRISRCRIWPAYPKALMFHHRRCCCRYHCSRAPTKVSLYRACEDIRYRTETTATLCSLVIWSLARSAIFSWTLWLPGELGSPRVVLSAC